MKKIAIALTLLGTLPAVAFAWSLAPLELARGMRFAAVGSHVGTMRTLGSKGYLPIDRWVGLEMSLETGIMVAHSAAVGAWISTVPAFVDPESRFARNPHIGFGASAGSYVSLGRRLLGSGTAKLGLMSLGGSLCGQRLGVSLALLGRAPGPFGLGLDVSALWDFVRLRTYDDAYSIFTATYAFGLKLQGFSR